MTKLSDRGPPIPGKQHGGEPADEEDNFYTCPICGQQVHMRDLRQVIWHETTKAQASARFGGVDERST